MWKEIGRRKSYEGTGLLKWSEKLGRDVGGASEWRRAVDSVAGGKKNVKICSRHAFRTTEMCQIRACSVCRARSSSTEPSRRVASRQGGSVMMVRQRVRGNDKKKYSRFISFVHRAFTAWSPDRVVFVLSEILPVSMARNSSKQRPTKRLTTVVCS